MSDLANLIDLLAPFFGLIGLGAASARIARLPAAGAAWMQFFLVYLALPSLFFRLISDKPIGELANLPFMAATTLATATAFGLSFAIARRGEGGLPGAVIGAVAGSYSNIGYMGPPLVIAFLGNAASAPVALIFVADTLFLFTAVPALMAMAGGSGESGRSLALKAAARIAFHPFLLATAVGLLASLLRRHPPEALDRMLAWLSNASAPCALFLLGVTVASQRAGALPAQVPGLVAVKLLVHPLLVWMLVSWLAPGDPVWAEAALIMAALPPALNVFVLASQYRAGMSLASACVLAGTLASTVTLTAILWLFKAGWLPPVLFRG